MRFGDSTDPESDCGLGRGLDCLLHCNEKHVFAIIDDATSDRDAELRSIAGVGLSNPLSGNELNSCS
jgi:hypothetical protein